MSNILKEIKVIKVEDDFISKNFDQQIAYRYLFELNCSNSIETTAYLHFKNSKPSNLAIDISTMIGCPMDCKFCATSSLKFIRELDESEIIEQVLLLIKKHDNPNIPEITCSFQGIGEPSLLAQKIVNVSRKLIAIDKRIIISIATMGNKLKAFEIWRESNLPIFSLQLSCSSVIQQKIKEIIPNTVNISLLIDELEKCTHATNIRNVKLNYILIDSYNDSNDDIDRLIKLLNNKNIIVKISSLNNTVNTKKNCLAQASKTKADGIVTKLRNNNIDAYIYGAYNNTTISCGQLVFNQGA